MTLEEFRPDILTLEFSHYGLHYRQAHKQALRRKLLAGLTNALGSHSLTQSRLKKLLLSSGIGGVAALLNLPFEYKGARYYSKRYRAPLFSLDVSSYSRELLKHADDILSPTNLQRLLEFQATPVQELVTNEYSSAKRLLSVSHGDMTPWPHPSAGNRYWQQRDRIMAMRITKILHQYPDRSLAHIGGWQHILPQPHSLFHHLKSWQPIRVLLGHGAL